MCALLFRCAQKIPAIEVHTDGVRELFAYSSKKYNTSHSKQSVFVTPSALPALHVANDDAEAGALLLQHRVILEHHCLGLHVACGHCQRRALERVLLGQCLAVVIVLLGEVVVVGVFVPGSRR